MLLLALLTGWPRFFFLKENVWAFRREISGHNYKLTVRRGSTVMQLFCLVTQGVLYDLFECLYSYMDGANLTSIPIYFISPVADSSLAYSNIFAEW